MVAWSRIFAESECLCAINTSLEHDLSVWAVVDRKLHPAGSVMSCRFSTSEPQVGLETAVGTACGASIRITVPAGGFVVYR